MSQKEVMPSPQNFGYIMSDSVGSAGNLLLGTVGSVASLDALSDGDYRRTMVGLGFSALAFCAGMYGLRNLIEDASGIATYLESSSYAQTDEENGLEAARRRTEVVFQGEMIPFDPEQRELLMRRLRSRLHAVRNGYEDQLGAMEDVSDNMKDTIIYTLHHSEKPTTTQKKLHNKADKIQRYIDKLDRGEPGDALKFLEIQICHKLSLAGKGSGDQRHYTSLNQTHIDIETLAAFDPVKADGLRMELNRLQEKFSSPPQF